MARGKQNDQLHQEQCGRVEFWQPEQQQRLPGVCAMRTPSDRGENLWFAGLLSESDNMASVVKALCGAHRALLASPPAYAWPLARNKANANAAIDSSAGLEPFSRLAACACAKKA